MNFILVVVITGLGYHLIPKLLKIFLTSQLIAKLPVPLSPVNTAEPFCTFKQVALLIKVIAMLLLEMFSIPPTLLIMNVPFNCWAVRLWGKAMANNKKFAGSIKYLINRFIFSIFYLVVKYNLVAGPDITLDKTILDSPTEIIL